MYKVHYVSKKEMPMAGAFGLCQYDTKEIFIRKDLPKYIQKNILAHERQHEADFERYGPGNYFWREIRANAVGAWKYPLGFIGCTVKTLSSFERIGFYLKRIF